MQEQKARKFFILRGVLLAILVVGLIIFFASKSSDDASDKIIEVPEEFTEIQYQIKQVQIKDTLFDVDVAYTQAERVQGLSGTTSIGEFEGLLFPFGSLDKHGIWMKDMNYSIDIIWIDDEFNIVHIEEKVSPDSFPEVFYPTQDSLYVLEVQNGAVERFSIEVGNTIDIII